MLGIGAFTMASQLFGYALLLKISGRCASALR
jgi:hypothetical protein